MSNEAGDFGRLDPVDENLIGEFVGELNDNTLHEVIAREIKRERLHGIARRLGNYALYSLASVSSAIGGRIIYESFAQSFSHLPH